MTVTTIPAPEGLKTGTWNIDPAHSEIGFTARHAAISKVRGRFTEVEGTVVVPEDIAASVVNATVQAASFDSGQVNRDEHVRGPEFLHVEQYPTLSFTSTGVRHEGGEYILDGNLTIKDSTKPVSFVIEFNGVATDPYGAYRAGFTGETQISRKEFGITFDVPLDGGGVLVGDKVKIGLELAIVHQG